MEYEILNMCEFLRVEIWVEMITGLRSFSTKDNMASEWKDILQEWKLRMIAFPFLKFLQNHKYA